MMIKRERNFDCKHGGVVPSHDILGQRQGKYFLVNIIVLYVYFGGSN